MASQQRVFATKLFNRHLRSMKTMTVARTEVQIINTTRIQHSSNGSQHRCESKDWP
jgi:hypothetical protein